MEKSSRKSLGKGPVPVLLTGKIWNPPKKDQAKKSEFPAFAFGVIVFFVAAFLWLLASSRPSDPVLEKPLIFTQKTPTTLPVAPIDDKIEKISVSTISSLVQTQPVIPVVELEPQKGAVESKSGSKDAKITGQELPVAENLAASEAQVKSVLGDINIPEEPVQAVASVIPTVPIETLPDSVEVGEKPMELAALPGSPDTSLPSGSGGEKAMTQVDTKPLIPKILTPEEKEPPKESASEAPKGVAIPNAAKEDKEPSRNETALIGAGETLPQDKLISGVPSLKKRSRVFMGLRRVLQADGWEITWVNRKKGVACKSETGSSLVIIPGKRRALFNGKAVYSPVRPIISGDGQLMVPIELLNKILAGRLSIIREDSSPNELKIRLASAEKKDGSGLQSIQTSLKASKELTGILAVRRRGHILVSLRQVLEADGWKVSWEGMDKGALCSKGDSQIYVVIPGKAKSRLNDASIRNKRTPVLFRERLLVAIGTLKKVCQGRISLFSFDKKSRQARINLVEG